MIALLPIEGMLVALGISSAEFGRRSPATMAVFLMSCTQGKASTTVAQSRNALVRIHPTRASARQRRARGTAARARRVKTDIARARSYA